MRQTDIPPPQVLQNWEELKLKEKDGNKSVLGGVPDSLPSIIKAYRIQDKARNVGFDWEKREDVWNKVNEEMNEVKTEIENKDKKNIEAEFGDLIFSIINAARLYGINPVPLKEQTKNSSSASTILKNAQKRQERTLKT